MSIRLAIAFSLAASLWGQKPSVPTPMSFSGMPPLAEDSPEVNATNLIFYDNPRGIQPREPSPAATVSVEQLQHPVSSKGVRLLNQARNFADMGRHDKAIAQLQIALKERSAVPYAHSMLGVEYLKTGQVPAAIAELQQAVTLLPRNAAVRSDLGYGLFLSGDLDRAEKEARQALELDHSNRKTQLVLNQILHARRVEASAQGRTQP